MWPSRSWLTWAWACCCSWPAWRSTWPGCAARWDGWPGWGSPPRSCSGSVLGALALALSRVRRLDALERLLDRLENRSAQLRVRATLTLALAFGVLAYQFGFASILGAFAAGLLVRIIEISGREPNRD